MKKYNSIALEKEMIILKKTTVAALIARTNKFIKNTEYKNLGKY